MKKFFIFVFFILLTGCTHIVSQAMNQDKIKIGMTPVELRQVIGNPVRTAKRFINENDIREVWEYLVRTPIFLEDNPTIHYYFVFHNNKLIGWNLPDPYVPDLIIEKRER